ncbi:hypothetical protein [Clostridium sardiniense]|uniref:hypothetical protein n=1 Tax=Clostridium sardiniense TaxID=29369 RepID=UPI003D32A508
MKKILDKKEIIIIIGLITLLISIPFIIGSMVKVHELDKPISIDNWLIYYATIGGALIGGFITAVGLYITIKQTREIQDENSKDIEKERTIEKDIRQIEYLKKLYIQGYKYEKYLKNNLGKSLMKIKKLDTVLNMLKSNKNDDFGSEIIEISLNIIDTLDDLNRNIIIESACIQSKEIKSLVILISNFQENIIDKMNKIISEIQNYDENSISEILSDEKNVFGIVIKLLIELNVEIYRDIENRADYKKVI